MKPRRTHGSTNVYSLAGGTEDNDLWVRITRDGDGTPIIASTWELTPEERERIAAGENIELAVWGGQPPVSLTLTDAPLGKRPEEPPDA